MTSTDSIAALTTPGRSQIHHHQRITLHLYGVARYSNLSLTTVSSGSLVFRSQRGYDASSNVTAVNTTLAAGTDNQVFCYDEQNRLTWAGSSGTPTCGSTLTPGSLTSASYTHTYAYDTLDRLTSGPLGSYSYGDSAHLHAATSIGTAYTASYDAVGDMTCRAADGSTTCSGTPTGAQLSYDNEGRLSHWQNTPTSPTTTDDFLYDGAGNRVEQQATISGSQATMAYVYVASTAPTSLSAFASSTSAVSASVAFGSTTGTGAGVGAGVGGNCFTCASRSAIC